MEKDTFRRSINGLRGLAVLMVVLFHWSHVRGGFTGVDIFFVISGFLISGHILRDLENDKFSFLGFYARRTRRIIPTLIAILFFCTVLGWFWSFDDQFRLLGKHIQSGALFVSNFRLYSESGYFDTAAETKPLLQLWSLAIEEQFYLIWPIVLWLSFRARKRVQDVVLCAAVLSFATCIYLSRHNTEMDFYLLPSRLWELAFGCLVFTSRSKLRRLYESKAAQIAGLALIVYGCLTLRGDAFPGFGALIPVVGTGFLLGASEGALVNSSVLSSRFLGFFGTISYPLYLWHWSLFSFMKSLMLDDHMIALGICTLAFSYLTHRFIEKPLMSISVTAKNRLRIISVGVSALIVFAVAGTATGNGWVHGRMVTRSLPAPQTADLGPAEGVSCGSSGSEGTVFFAASFKPCDAMPYPGAPVVLLVGDSHAGSLNAGLRVFAKQKHFNLVTFTAVYCVPLSLHDRRPSCRAFNQYVDSWIAKWKPDLVVLDAHYRFWVDNEGYGESVPYVEFAASRLSGYRKITGKQVLLVGQNPTWHISLPRVLNIAYLARGVPVPVRTYQGISEDTLQLDDALKAEAARLRIPYFSIKDELCTSAGCRVRVGDHYATDLMEFDYGHLSPEGALFVVENGLGAKIEELLKQFGNN